MKIRERKEKTTLEQGNAPKESIFKKAIAKGTSIKEGVVKNVNSKRGTKTNSAGNNGENKEKGKIGTVIKNIFKEGISKSGITIRTQLIIGFVIPIIFLLVVGIVSYQRAAGALESNYEQSTTNALEMTRNSLDSSLRVINQQVMEMVQDTNVRSYSLGAYIGKSGQQMTSRNAIKTTVSVKETASDIVQDIYVIPVDGEEVVTSKTLDNSKGGKGADSFMEALKKSEDSFLFDNAFVNWGETHPFFDSCLGISMDEYTLFCYQAFKQGGNQGIVIFDISTQGIKNLLQQLDFGENSHVAFVMANGREVNTSTSTRK